MPRASLFILMLLQFDLGGSILITADSYFSSFSELNKQPGSACRHSHNRKGQNRSECRALGDVRWRGALVVLVGARVQSAPGGWCFVFDSTEPQ